MKYLVSMIHGPDTCAFTDERRRQRAQQAAGQATEIAERHGVTIDAAFANPVAHRTWLYVEADDPSHIEQVLIDTGMFMQNRCVIEPVRSLQETTEMLAEV